MSLLGGSYPLPLQRGHPTFPESSQREHVDIPHHLASCIIGRTLFRMKRILSEIWAEIPALLFNPVDALRAERSSHVRRLGKAIYPPACRRVRHAGQKHVAWFRV